MGNCQGLTRQRIRQSLDWQGLKPAIFLLRSGTAEAVPLLQSFVGFVLPQPD
jgi:hypothetical protein